MFPARMICKGLHLLRDLTPLHLPGTLITFPWIEECVMSYHFILNFSKFAVPTEGVQVTFTLAGANVVALQAYELHLGRRKKCAGLYSVSEYIFAIWNLKSAPIWSHSWGSSLGPLMSLLIVSLNCKM